jgi:hypothetical protein
MSAIVSTSSPNEEGEMLWCVHYMSSYYDTDERAPGRVPVDGHFFVLAKNRDEALSKVEPGLKKVRKESDKGVDEKIETTVIAIEELIPARDSSNDGRIGWHCTTELSKVELFSPEDTKRYRLAVCLVPVN